MMPLHIVKFCVGISSIAELEARIATLMHIKAAQGLAQEHIHTTRMVPKRKDELLDHGSMYWVIKGHIACRQNLLDIRIDQDEQGKSYAGLVLEPVVVPVRTVPRRPFQGWRYLNAQDAPPDITALQMGDTPMPEAMQRDLIALGLL